MSLYYNIHRFITIYIYSIFSIFICFSTCSAAFIEELWEPSKLASSPSDRRRALPNDPSPPKVCIPKNFLSPLPSAFIGVIRRVDVPKHIMVVALTFDMCELETKTTGYDADIVNFLRTQNIPATFFLGGKWMRTHAERAMQLIADPLFEIGNHAWTHGNFGIMNALKMKEQVLWTQAQYEVLRESVLQYIEAEKLPILDIPQSLHLFRLPYGRCTKQALKLIAQLGLHVIQWDVMAENFSVHSLVGLDHSIHNRITSGSIILFHANCVHKGSAVLLKRVVTELKKQGYQFVTVGTLLTMGKPQYTSDGYFLSPGDNKSLDTMFGIDGTGATQ